MKKASFNVIKNPKPSSMAKKTYAFFSDPGITYNQASVAYNASGYTYGGISGFQDKAPTLSKINTKL